MLFVRGKLEFAETGPSTSYEFKSKSGRKN